MFIYFVNTRMTIYYALKLDVKITHLNISHIMLSSCIIKIGELKIISIIKTVSYIKMHFAVKKFKIQSNL